MSTKGVTILPNAIARDGIVPPNERLVLLALASHAGSENVCRVLRSTLVREVGISRASVTRALKWLVESGYVIIQHNKSSMGRGSSTYRLNLKVYEDITVEEDLPEEDVSEAHTEHQSGSQGAGVRLTQSTSEAHREPTREEEPSKRTFEKAPSSSSSPSVTPEAVAAIAGNLTEAAEDLFDRFWFAYPKKDRRIVAKAAWTAAVLRGISPALLIEKAEGYARLCRKEERDSQYIQAPSEWLKLERWTDEYPKPPVPKAKLHPLQRSVAE